MIRDWRTTLLEEGVSASVTAKAYRLLRAILMTASEDDRIIPRNPCRIRGAGDERPDERPVLTVAQVFELADLVGRRPVGNIRKVGPNAYRLRYQLRDGDMRTFPQNFPTKAAADRVLLAMADDGHAHVRQDDRLRALILLATFASLRWGELIALQRQDIDIEAGTVTVRHQYLEMDSGKLVLGPPKSRAGSRTVRIPASILPAIRSHLDRYVADEPTALVCTGANGGVLRRGNFRRASRWAGAVAAIGVPGLHFHDLRHTGNNIAAESGVSLRDLMDRMGQDSVRAAMIYQHGTSKASGVIAEALNDQITAVMPSDENDDQDDDDGTVGVLVPVG